MLTIQDFSSRLRGIYPGGDGWTSALCPAHDDHRQSFSFRMTEDGIQFKCHAGCDRKDILAAMNLTEGDVWVESGMPLSDSHVDATYPYHDEVGELLFETVRRFPKSFCQRRPATPDDLSGKVKTDLDGRAWVYSLTKANGEPVRRVLYRLPELLEAVRHGRTVYIVEGEKDADNLVKLGFCATTSPQGAGKWKDEYSIILKDAARIVICPDNDPAPSRPSDKGYPGQRHAADIVRSIRKLGVFDDRMHVLEVPGAKDVSDWIKAGGTAEELRSLSDTAPTGAAWLSEWEPRFKRGATAGTGVDGVPSGISDLDIRNTDKWNADRLVAMYGEDLLYDGDTWYVWDGRRYAPDVRDRRIEYAKQVAEANVREALSIEDTKEQAAAVRAATRSLQVQRLRAMIELAASDEKIRVVPDDLDADLDLFNVTNGTIDLRTGTLRPHDRADRITKLADVDFDPEATSPNFDAFLNFIMGGNQSLVAYLQRFAGSCLSGDARDQVFHVWHGGGSNGKGTLIRALFGVMGEYARSANTETFLEHAAESNGSSHQEDLARLRGIRFVAAEEASPGRKLNIGRIKTMTGGDKIVARMPYGRHSVEYTPQFTLVFVTNHEPNVPSADHGTWRRLRKCPFNVTISQEMREQNPDFEADLFAESAGILRWAIEGCLIWRAEGLQPPQEVMAATTEWRSDTNPVLQFVNDACVTGPGLRCLAGDIYDAYKLWCSRNDEDALKQSAFGSRLGELQFARERGSKGVRYWTGIDLKVEGDEVTRGDTDSQKESYTYAYAYART